MPPDVEEVIPSATEAVEPDPTDKVDTLELKPAEVTEPENAQDTLPIEEPPSPKHVSELRNDSIEILVDAEPVVARPLPIFVVPEDVKPIVEEAPAVNPVEDVVPHLVSEQKFTAEAEVPTMQPEEVEEPASSLGVVEQEVPTPVVPEPVVEPANQLPAFDVPEPYVSAPELTSGEVPPAEPESLAESREIEAVDPPGPSEEEAAVGTFEPEQVPSAIPEPVEVEKDALISDAPQEGAEQVDRPLTPSYSVSSQGGGLDRTAFTDGEVAEAVVVPEPPVEEPDAPTPEIVTPAEVCAPDV